MRQGAVRTSDNARSACRCHEIDALLNERRASFPPFPPAVARERARRTTRTSTPRRRRSRGVLGRVCVRARVDAAVDAGARLAAAAREVVRRRHSSTPAPTASTATSAPRAQQGRDHLGRRARRSPDADLLRSASPGLPVRERPEVARREEGRSRRALPAADSRAGDRDARLRAHRRRAQRRVRRLQRRVAARSHQRRAGVGARHRRRRLSPRPDRAAQADGRRGAAGHAVDPARRRRAARPRRRRFPCTCRKAATTGTTS